MLCAIHHKGYYRSNQSKGEDKRFWRYAHFKFLIHKIGSLGSLIFEEGVYSRFFITAFVFQWYYFFTYLWCVSCFSIKEITLLSLTFCFLHSFSEPGTSQGLFERFSIDQTYNWILSSSCTHCGTPHSFTIIIISDSTFFALMTCRQNILNASKKIDFHDTHGQ